MDGISAMIVAYIRKRTDLIRKRADMLRKRNLVTNTCNSAEGVLKQDLLKIEKTFLVGGVSPKREKSETLVYF